MVWYDVSSMADDRRQREIDKMGSESKLDELEAEFTVMSQKVAEWCKGNMAQEKKCKEIDMAQKVLLEQNKATESNLKQQLAQIEADGDAAADGQMSLLLQQYQKTNEENVEARAQVITSQAELQQRIDEAQNEVDAVKETTQQSHLKMEHDKTEGDAELRQIKTEGTLEVGAIIEQQNVAKQAIEDAEQCARAKIAQKQQERADVEKNHAELAEELIATNRRNLQESQSIEDKLRNQLQANADALKQFQQLAAQKQAHLDAKQEKHDLAIADQKAKAEEQKEKIDKLRDLPIMLREVEGYDAKMKEAEKYHDIYLGNEAELRRQHYVGSNHHKEEIFLLTKDYERLHGSNQKRQNRLSYGLRNPYL